MIASPVISSGIEMDAAHQKNLLGILKALQFF